MPSLITSDVGQSGYGTAGANIPHDWTEGTGVMPAGGVILISNPGDTGQTRKWLLIQNQSAINIVVGVSALNALGVLGYANILIGSGGSIGSQGGAQEFGLGSWCPTGRIQITAPAGTQLLVIEVLE